MEEVSEATQKVWRNIIARIKKLRREKNVTLDRLSERTGFTKSYLSQIENMKREAPISTLAKIAYALNVDLLYLLTGETMGQEEEGISIVRPHERKLVMPPSGSPEYRYESLTYKKKNRLMDAFIITAGCDFPRNPVVHDGQELTFMLEGRQEFVYNGRIYIMETGDCYVFDSIKPHYSRSISETPARFLVVYVNKP